MPPQKQQKDAVQLTGKCRICGCKDTVTRDYSLCLPCLRDEIAKEYRPVRTYLGYERVGRKQLEKDRFDRAELTDFDAQCSLGGRPDYDAWFPPQHEDFGDDD